MGFKETDRRKRGLDHKLKSLDARIAILRREMADDVEAAGTDCADVQVGPPLEEETYILRLYVAGQTRKSLAAFANLKRIYESHLAGRYRIEIIDLLENPTLAKGDQILAIPTLVRRLPPPVRKIIGDLSNTERVLVGLDLRAGR